jgi:two-component system sensor histidine kinase UhpB
MKYWTLQWGIKERVILITAFPVVLMFILIVVWSRVTSHSAIQQELEERGHVVAAALAESSQYGVISGNISYLERTVDNLLHVDKSISDIEIQDLGRKAVLKRAVGRLGEPGAKVFEAPIRKELIDVDMYSGIGPPHVPNGESLNVVPQHNDVVGFVHVTMSPLPLLAKRQQRDEIHLMIAGVSLIASLGIGLYLALGLTRPLANTITALTNIKRGNYAIEPPEHVGGEIGVLQTTMIEMANNLWLARQELEAKVVARTRELERARDEAVRSDDEKRRLIQKVNQVVEEERKHIALEIHDHLNAELIVARLEAQRIFDLALKLERSEAIQAIQGMAQSVLDRLFSLYGMTREIVKRLRPEVIDTLGLRDAVEEMIRQYNSLHATCVFEFHAVGDFSDLRGDLAISTYRIIQEALSNVVKHSAATTASVRLDIPDRENVLRIHITDNGKGFDHNRVDFGIGILGMRERTQGLGGTFAINTAPGEGTEIHIALPCVVKQCR